MAGCRVSSTRSRSRADELIRAYEDIGMRVSYSFALRDQNRSSIRGTRISSPACRPSCGGRCSTGTSDSSFASTTNRAVRGSSLPAPNKRRVKIQLAPANLHWCSDNALTALSDLSRSYDKKSRCTCISWRPPIRRNTPSAAVLRHAPSFMISIRITNGAESNPIWFPKRRKAWTPYDQTQPIRKTTSAA